MGSPTPPRPTGPSQRTEPFGRLSAVPVAVVLQLIAEGALEAAGASTVTVAVARDDHHVQVVAAASGGTTRRALVGARTPVAELLDDLDAGEDQGPVRALPGRLLAPLRDEDGQLRGVLTAYLPGSAPPLSPAQLRGLGICSDQATRAVVTALGRERLAEQLRLAETARHVVRQASETRSLQHVLETARPALLDGFRALGMWIETFDEDGLGRGSIYSADGRNVEIPEHVHTIAYNTAHALWENQHTIVLSARRPSRLLSQSESRDVAEFLDGLGVDSILFVPVGAGHQCLGNLALTRDATLPEWSDDEAAAAMEIGRDLGVAVHSVRSYERERRLVRELHVLEARLTGVAPVPTGPPDPSTEPGDGDVDLARTRAALRSASDTLEQTGRRRDAQARIVADALALGEAPARGALDVYRTLRTEYRDAHLYWQVAFDAWQEVSARQDQPG